MKQYHETWVADDDDDFEPVTEDTFDDSLDESPQQKQKQREDARVDARDLLDVRVEGARITNGSVSQDDVFLHALRRKRYSYR